MNIRKNISFSYAFVKIVERKIPANRKNEEKKNVKTTEQNITEGIMERKFILFY
jgi:hypothetical protein